jgi:pimeloyl-ACP methyl ester carboxylesterase
MIHYTSNGNGQPIVLIHGYGEDYRIWENQLPVLQKEYRVIVPHLPGTGYTAFQPGISMDSMAADILEILDHEKIDKTVILGHSMGGYITLAFAEKYGNRLKGFGLVHSTAFADDETKKEARKKSIEFIRQYGSKAFLESTTPNLFSIKNRKLMVKTIEKIATENAYILPDALIAFTEAMMARPDRTAVLKQARIPVLFIVGKEDQAVPFSDTMQQVHLPELSYIHILDQSGHMGMLEEPEKTNLFLQQFLKNS